MQASPDSVQIDVISDVVCPWCYIGKRKLEGALSQLGQSASAVSIRWLPFQLNPQLPREGMPRKQYLEQKFGGAERAAQVYARITAAGLSAGLDFQFDKIERQPNTVDAHRLIAWAQHVGNAEPLVEALFRAYFTEGRYIGDRDELALIAGASGFDATAAAASLASDSGADEIAEAAGRARQLHVSGVPFFIFNNRLTVSGAQETSLLLDAIVQARQTAAA